MKEVEYREGETITIIEAPERSGYTFIEWRGSSYQPGDSYEVEEDHTFTAIWEVASADGTKKDSVGQTAEEISRLRSVKTGDESMLPWVMLIIISSGTLVFIGRRRYNER